MSLTGEAPRAAIMPVARSGGRLLAATGAGLGLRVVVTGIHVVGRYLFNRPFGGAFQIIQMSLAALVFVAPHLFSLRVQRWLGRFAAVVVALFELQLVLLGLQQMGSAQGRRASACRSRCWPSSVPPIAPFLPSLPSRDPRDDFPVRAGLWGRWSIPPSPPV